MEKITSKFDNTLAKDGYYYLTIETATLFADFIIYDNSTEEEYEIYWDIDRYEVRNDPCALPPLELYGADGFLSVSQAIADIYHKLETYAIKGE